MHESLLSVVVRSLKSGNLITVLFSRHHLDCYSAGVLSPDMLNVDIRQLSVRVGVNLIFTGSVRIHVLHNQSNPQKRKGY